MKKLTQLLLVMLLAYTAMGQKAPRLKTVTDVCDMALFTYSVKSSVKAKTSVAIRWVRPQVSGISNAASSGGNGEISEYLDNTTALPVKVRYLITMTLPGGCDHTDTLQVTVNPTPRLTTPLVAQVCDSATLNYVPESNVKSALFTWSRPAVQGIRNEATTGTEKISEPIYNDMFEIRKVPYYIQSKDKGCTGYDTVWTTVVPRPFGLIDINPVDTVKSGQILKLKFVTTDTIGKKYTWLFGDNMSATTQLNPVEHFYNTRNSGYMPLKLNITNTFGCANNFNGSVFVVGDPTARPTDSIAVQRNYSMAAFPVPFTSDLRLKYSLRGPDEKAMYYVNDLSGKIIYAQQIMLPGGDQVIKLPSDRLYAGVVYTIRIISKTFNYEDKVYRK
jgi:hypothetical protein